MLRNNFLRFMLFLVFMLCELLLSLFWLLYAKPFYYPAAFFLLLISLVCLYRAWVYLQNGLYQVRKEQLKQKYLQPKKT